MTTKYERKQLNLPQTCGNKLLICSHNKVSVFFLATCLYVLDMQLNIYIIFIRTCVPVAQW